MLTDIPRKSLNSGLPCAIKHGKYAKGSEEMQRSEEPPKKTLSKHRFLLSVETKAKLVWEGWEPEEEYTKLLVIKNVHDKIQKLTFRPPASRFFHTQLPRPIVLSSGTSFSLPVTFRPIQKCKYVDSIEFKSKENSLQVTLHAVGPKHALKMPHLVEVPLCAIYHSTNTSFTIQNISKWKTGFQWIVQPPFALYPDTGTLQPGEKCKVTVTFKPQKVLVYQTKATCKFGEKSENSSTILIKGLSKYPHLQIHSHAEEEGCAVLQFGRIGIGNSIKKHFEIHNPSLVSASFSLTRVPGPALMESVFQCHVQEGLVTPGSVVKVPVCFTPLTVDSTSVDYFLLTCPGAVKRNMLKAMGSCVGPVVSLSSSLVNFGCVEEGEEVTHAVQIKNTSKIPAHYQFDLDTHSNVFTVDQPSDTLPASSSHILHLSFCPHHPIAYHKRLVCLILHREPLFLDLVGTCHSKLLKPSVLQPRHLQVHRINVFRGLSYYPPDILDTMLDERKLKLDEHGALLLQENPPEDTALSRLSLSQKNALVEYFHNCSAGEAELGTDESTTPFIFPRHHVTVQPTEMVFYTGPASQTVSITNHTKGKIKLLWTPVADSPFSITPLTFELRPLKSTSFRVKYEPKQLNTFFAEQLECFALYEVLQDHWQTEDRTLCPSWCLTVRVSAHSFQPGNQHFVPRVTLQHPQVVFPALNQVSYQTVLLQNTGNLPLIFKLNLEECPFVCVLPSSGLIPAGSHQILTLRTTPSKDRTTSLPLTLLLNASHKHTLVLSVLSVVEKLCVTLDGDEEVFFMPTAVGCCSKRTMRVRNLSREAVYLQWKVFGQYHKVVSVQPKTGILHPNESQVCTWSFIPKKEMMYLMKAKLTFWPVRAPNCKKSSLSVKVKGQAAMGSIEAAHTVLKLGEVLVGSCKSFEILLLNNSLCSLSFSLSVIQSITALGFTEDFVKDPVALEIDSMTGKIPARCRLPLYSTVGLTRRAQYSWTIYYQILNMSGAATGVPRPLCQVQAQGVYPILEVTDARSSGSAEDVSKQQLWGLFSLDLLNSFLLSEPSPSEPTYREPTNHSPCHFPPCFTSTVLDFNFIAASLGAEPSIYLLTFENTGNVTTEWSFLFPDDQQIELDYKSDSGEISPTELHQMKVQDSKLFSISPRSGRLQPGQQRAVQFSYRHVSVGSFCLPVLLKLSHGKEISLNFIGVTIERDTYYLQFPTTRHVFAPVAVGQFYPLQQVYELYNRGSLPVTYHVDMSPLQQLKLENFDHPVLQCLTPEGEVQPGHTVRLEWLFSPLEAKTYSVDVPIYVLEGDCTIVTFEGHGLDKKDFQKYDEYLNVPCTQKVALPEQVVFLSQDMVAFGDIPVYSRKTHILFLTNVSCTDRVMYSWNLGEDGNQEVQIRPAEGSLGAGESVLCVLSIHTSGTPTFYQYGLICEITPVEALARYKKDLQCWEEEKEREKYEFTITEKDLQDKHGQILTPIGNGNYDVSTEKPFDMINKTARGRPEPPRSTLLHLGVTARSHNLLEYQSQFPFQINKRYIYRSEPTTVSQNRSDESQLSSSHLQQVLHGPERENIEHAITNVLRSLLDDPDFHQMVQNISNEPVPYFSLLRPATVSADNVAQVEPGPVVEPQPEPQHKIYMKMQERETISRSVEFGDLMEEIHLNTLQNLMTEAFLGELILTARPRVIALPPCSTRRKKSSTGRRSKEVSATVAPVDQRSPPTT